MKSSIYILIIIFLPLYNSCNPKFECDKFGAFDHQIFYNKIFESDVSHHQDKMSSFENSLEFFPDGTVSLYTNIDSLSFIRKGTFEYDLILSDCYCYFMDGDDCYNPYPFHGGIGTISMTESNDTICDYNGGLTFEFYVTEIDIEIKILSVNGVDCFDNILFCSGYESCGYFRWVS